MPIYSGQLNICFEGAGNSEQYKGTCQPDHREPRAESKGGGADLRAPRGGRTPVL